MGIKWDLLVVFPILLEISCINQMKIFGRVWGLTGFAVSQKIYSWALEIR